MKWIRVELTVYESREALETLEVEQAVELSTVLLAVSEVARSLLSSSKRYAYTKAAVRPSSVIGLLAVETTARGSGGHSFEDFVVYIGHPVPARLANEGCNASSLAVQNRRRISECTISRET